MFFIRQQKSTITTNTIQGSSSSSTVSRTLITSSSTFHSKSSSTFYETSTAPNKVLETTKHFERLNIKQPANVVYQISTDPKVLETTSHLERLSIKQPENGATCSKADNFVSSKSDTMSSSKVNSNEQFQLECLNAHNEYRRKHGVGPLKLNPTLSNFAQNWANVSSITI